MTTSVVESAFLPTHAPGRADKSIKKYWFGGSISNNDVQHGGAYRVRGTTAVAGSPDVPVARLVVLFSARSKRPVRSLISSPAGDYDFIGVARGPWFVVAYDDTGEYNAVIADNILAEPM